MLARAGHVVTLIGRAQHMDAVRRRGLRLETSSFDESVALQGSLEASAVRGAQLVLFCVKSTDTEVAGSGIAPYLDADALVLALWAKLVVNCAYNALSAITQLPYGRLVQGEGIAATMQDEVQECLAVAQALGVAIPGDMAEAVRGIAGSMAGQMSSTAQDLARGRRTEIDHLNGYVVGQGEALGIATPVNRALWALVKLLEGRGRPEAAPTPDSVLRSIA